MWTESQLAYLAGIVDGEGSVYLQKIVRKTGFHYDLRFHVVNTNRNLIHWIKDRFGGLVYEKDRSSHSRNWKLQYTWNASRSLFDQIAPHILPFLIVKREQVELGIAFRKTFIKSNRHHGDMVTLTSFREECLHKMRSLNKKGL